MKNEMKLNNKGFSLVELIVVIAIMAILVGVLAPSVLGQLDKAKVAKDKQTIDTIATAVVVAYTDPDITGSKEISSFPLGTTTEYTGTPNIKSFMDVIHTTVGYTQVQIESNEYKGADAITIEINTTTNKVKVKLMKGTEELYSTTK